MHLAHWVRRQVLHSVGIKQISLLGLVLWALCALTAHSSQSSSSGYGSKFHLLTTNANAVTANLVPFMVACSFRRFTPAG